MGHRLSVPTRGARWYRGPMPTIRALAASLALITIAACVPAGSGPAATAEVRAADPAIRAGGPAIHGRVVDVRSGEPFTQATIRLTLGRRHRQEVRTDATGGFSIVPEIDASHASLWIQPDYPWRWVLARSGTAVTLSPEERSGIRPFLFEVAERRTAPVHGVAVEHRTGAPLPDFPFMIQSPTKHPSGRPGVEVVTDAEGRFATEEAVRGGLLEIRTARNAGSHVADGRELLVPGPWRLAFAVEPRLDVALAGAVPVDPTKLSFRVGWRGGVGRLPAMGIPMHSEPAAGPWVRVPTPRIEPSAGDETFLVLSDEAGLLCAESPFRWGVPDQGPLLFDLEVTAALVVEVDPERPPGETEDIRWSDDQVRVTLAPDEEGTLPEGAWQLEHRKWLPPGSYEVTVSSRRHEEERRTVVLEPGEVEHLTVPLRFARDLRTVRGTIRTESGTPPPKQGLQVTLSTGEGSRTWSADQPMGFCATGVDHFIQIVEEAGDEIGRFTFEDVPRVPMSISYYRTPVPAVFELTEHPSGDLLVSVLLLEGEGGPGFGFRVTDGDGTALPYRVHSRPHDGGPPLYSEDHDGRVIDRGHPSARDVDWAVEASGHRPAYGTQADFLAEGGDRYFARVALEPGWGSRVRVTDEGGTPLAGAAISLDGTPAGLTDGHGWFELSLERAPEAIEVAYQGLPAVREEIGRTVSGHPVPRPWIELSLGRGGDD